MKSDFIRIGASFFSRKKDIKYIKKGYGSTILYRYAIVVGLYNNDEAHKVNFEQEDIRDEVYDSVSKQFCEDQGDEK